MSQVILDKRGSIDKYIGDAIMSFWGAPVDEKQNSVRACEAALLMIQELEQLKKSAEWQKEKLPDVHIGIGINTGTVVVGNVGSEKRYDYTALGDEVNLASRLEGLTKTYGADILVSEQTVRDLENGIPTRELDSVMVKGKKQAVKIYEVLSEEKTKKNKESYSRYAKALDLYKQRRFAEAKKLFSQNKNDVASRLMASRCDELSKMKLPKDWGGSFEMKTK
jgi:adenylate cyclase